MSRITGKLHGECFLAHDDVLWWSKGGALKGESAPRMEFLRTILEQTPPDAAGIDPLPSDYPTGGVEGRYYLTYFGVSQPRLHTFGFPSGTRFRAELIDTWNMTLTELPDIYEETFTVPLPGRPYIAVRLRALDE